MSFVSKLTKQGKTLFDFNGAYAELGADFIPPTTPVEVQTAPGTAANQYGGAEQVNDVSVNAELNFSFNLQSTSSYANSHYLRRLNRILRNEIDEDDPLYFEFNSDDSVPEPLWGTLGANQKWRVVGGAARYGDVYLAANVRSGEIPNCQCAMQLQPHPETKQMRIGSATGGIQQD